MHVSFEPKQDKEFVGEPKVAYTRKMTSLAWTLLIVLLVTFSTGCGGSAIRHRAESEIARFLQQRIGPAKSYRVKLSGSTWSIIHGKIRQIRISADDVQLANGITLARLDVLLEGVRVDTATHLIRECKGAHYVAAVSSDEMERYLRKRYTAIPQLKIELSEGAMRIEAVPRVAGLSVPITAYASLKKRDDTEVVIDLQKIDVGWVPTPGFAKEYLEKRLNPVFEAADIGMGARINDVRIEKGFLILAGEFDPIKALGERKENTSGNYASGQLNL
jgi:hypothetical protein